MSRSSLGVAAVIIGCFWLAVVLLARMAPHDYWRPVAPHSVHFSNISWPNGNPCFGSGGIVSVTATNSSGPYTIYSVMCGNGLVIPAAK